MHYVYSHTITLSSVATKPLLKNSPETLPSNMHGMFYFLSFFFSLQWFPHKYFTVVSERPTSPWKFPVHARSTSWVTQPARQSQSQPAPLRRVHYSHYLITSTTRIGYHDRLGLTNAPIQLDFHFHRGRSIGSCWIAMAPHIFSFFRGFVVRDE
jgi:hypothetical protein